MTKQEEPLTEQELKDIEEVDRWLQAVNEDTERMMAEHPDPDEYDDWMMKDPDDDRTYWERRWDDLMWEAAMREHRPRWEKMREFGLLPTRK